MQNRQKRLISKAWLLLLLTYLVAFAVSFVAGLILIKVFAISPEQIYHVSTKRLSYALPVIKKGTEAGIDAGVLIFVWNSIGALVTISFIYSAALFNPGKMSLFPQRIRKLFCGRARMKLFCFLPGCRSIAEESIRRVYVWLMIPLLGMMLLGAESGLTVSTSTYLFDSMLIAFVSLLPHGIIEIPSIALAGAVSFSGHLLLKREMAENGPREIFSKIETYRNNLPVQMISLSVLLCLLSAGLVEARITTSLIAAFLS